MLRFSAIAEAGARILNPLSPEKLTLLGDIVGFEPGATHLDLACGKGEMVCQFAARHDVSGVGVDIHPPFVAEASERAAELGVGGRVRFSVGDAGNHGVAGPFDVVSCIGATWIGGGFRGSVDLMARSLAPGGKLLVGEVFLEGNPPGDLLERHGGTLAGMTGLGGIVDLAEAAGFELVEMVLASRDDWDRYVARQWTNVRRWLEANPDDPEAADVRSHHERSRRAYLEDERNWLGWGVFVLQR